MLLSVKLKKELSALVVKITKMREDGEDISELLKEGEELKAKISQAEAEEVKVQELQEGLDTPATPAVTADSAVEVQAAHERQPRAITHVRDRSLDDPCKGFRSPRHFLMGVMRVNRVAENSGRVALAKELGLHILSSGGPGSVHAAVGSDEQAGYADEYGAFLIPEGFSPDMMALRPEASVIAGLPTNIPMTTPTVRLPYRVDKDHSTSVSGGLTVARRTEASEMTSSRMKFGRLVFSANSLYGFSHATEELLTDSPVSFVAILSAGFGDEFGSHLDGERLNGTGAGEFLGVLNCAAKVEVAKETDQAAASIVHNNIIKMMARCWRFSNAVWIANQTVMTQLPLLNTASGTAGGLVFQPSAREGLGATLYGRPILYSEHCSALGTVGDLILGTWSEYYEGTYQPMESAESIHVRFIYHERCFKFWLRNEGRPSWETVLTPKNGDTLAPWVTLATRA